MQGRPHAPQEGSIAWRTFRRHILIDGYHLGWVRRKASFEPSRPCVPNRADDWLRWVTACDPPSLDGAGSWRREMSQWEPMVLFWTQRHDDLSAMTCEWSASTAARRRQPETGLDLDGGATRGADDLTTTISIFPSPYRESWSDL